MLFEREANRKLHLTFFCAVFQDLNISENLELSLIVCLCIQIYTFGMVLYMSMKCSQACPAIRELCRIYWLVMVLNLVVSLLSGSSEFLWHVQANTSSQFSMSILSAAVEEQYHGWSFNEKSHVPCLKIAKFGNLQIGFVYNAKQRSPPALCAPL